MPDAPAPAAQAAPKPPTTASPPPAAGSPTPGQPPPQEPAKVDAKATADRDAAALARARRVESANRETEARLKADQAKFEDERKHHAGALAEAAEFKRIQEAKAKGPRATLKALGYTEQEILEEIAKGDVAKTPETIAKEIVDKELAARDEKAKKDAEAKAKTDAEQAQVNARAIYARAQDDLTKLVRADPDKYEFCNRLQDPGKRAYAIVEEYWNLTSAEGRPELLPFGDALEALEEDLEKEHLTFSESSKKLKARAEAEAAAKKKQAEEAAATAVAARKGPRESRPMSGFKTPPKAPEPTASAAPEAAATPPKEPPSAEHGFRVSARRQRLADWRAKQRPNDA